VIRVAVVDDQALVRTGLRTLGARDRAQLVVFAIRSGLEPPPSDG
jgi:DNA-binding NarL/FixJ family response regulator